MLKALDKYFFSTSQYNPMGLLRIALCLWIIKPYLGVSIAHFPNETFFYEGAYEAPFFLRVFPLPFPITGEQLQLLHIALFIASGLALIGFCTRVSVFLTGFFQMYVEALNNANSIFNHEICLSCQVLMFMAFVPGVQSLSLDNIIRWAFNTLRKRQEPLVRAFVGPPTLVWGTKFILIMLSLVYFTAGFSKMRWTGPRWLDGQTLAYYLSDKPSVYRTTDAQRFFGNADIPDEKKWKDGYGIHSHHYGNHKPPPMPRRLQFLSAFENLLHKTIIDLPGMIVVLSIATIIFEMGAPIMLLGGWYRNIVLVSAMILHQTIGILMGLPFLPYKIICFFLLDWELIYRTLYRHVPAFRKVAKDIG